MLTEEPHTGRVVVPPPHPALTPVIAAVRRAVTGGTDPADTAQRTDYRTGEITWFTPPGDIHQVHDPSATTSISVHVYGADLGRADSSVRRYYDRTEE